MIYIKCPNMMHYIVNFMKCKRNKLFNMLLKTLLFV